MIHRLIEASLNRLIYHLGTFAPQGFTQADTRQLHYDFLCIREKISKEQRYQHPRTKLTADLDVFSRLHGIISTLSNSPTLSRWSLDDILAFQLLPDRIKWVSIRDDGGKLRSGRGAGMALVNSVIRRMSGGPSSIATNGNINNQTEENGNLNRRNSINLKNHETASRRYSQDKDGNVLQERVTEVGLEGNLEQHGQDKGVHRKDQKQLENNDCPPLPSKFRPLSFRLNAFAKLMANREQKINE